LRQKKAAESLRKGIFLEKSLSIVILRVVSILGSKPIFFFSVSSKKYKTIVSGEIFLKVEEVETFLEKYLII